MKRLGWLVVAGLVAAPFAGCGPDEKPSAPCQGPSINLLLTAENGPLPAGTHINVRYGGNSEGEAYTLGDPSAGQAVFCEQDFSARPGDVPDVPAAGGAGGAGGAPSSAEEQHVWALHCRLYTQGPARLDATADGYEPLADEPLSLSAKKSCNVEIPITLQRLLDAGL